MLNIPSRIKDLFHTDSIKKNIRVTFPYGGHKDITNHDILLESFDFKESLCSRSELKYGLAEASSINFTMFGRENIKGSTIDVFLEVDTSTLQVNSNDIYIKNLIFFRKKNVRVRPFNFSTVLESGDIYTTSNITFVTRITDVLYAKGGYNTVRYIGGDEGYVLDVIYRVGLEDIFPKISNNSYIYDEYSGSLSKVRKLDERYWEIKGVTNLKDPYSPNYDFYKGNLEEQMVDNIYETDDVAFPYYKIPLGRFLVTSSARQSNMNERAVEASTDVGKFFSLPELEVSKLRIYDKWNKANPDAEDWGLEFKVYHPIIYGILSYYGIFNEKLINVMGDSETDNSEYDIFETEEDIPFHIFDKTDTNHIYLNRSIEEKPDEVYGTEDSIYLGKSINNTDIYLAGGVKIPINMYEYFYTVANRTATIKTVDDVYVKENIYKVRTVNETDFQNNSFALYNGEYAYNMGEEIINACNAITETVIMEGVDSNDFMFESTIDSKTNIGRIFINLFKAAYDKAVADNGYKSLVVPRVTGTEETAAEVLNKFGGDLPPIFNNENSNLYTLYPWKDLIGLAVSKNVTKAATYNFETINIPVVALFRLAGSWGFALESKKDFSLSNGIRFITSSSEFKVTEFCYKIKKTDYYIYYKGKAVFKSGIRFDRFDSLDITPKSYDVYPTATITKFKLNDTDKKRIVNDDAFGSFKDFGFEKDDFGYYKNDGIDIKKWITDYYEIKGAFCVFDRGTNRYKERYIKSSYKSFYPQPDLFPQEAPNLYPMSTDIKIYRSWYESGWYDEKIKGPIKAIKYDYTDIRWVPNDSGGMKQKAEDAIGYYPEDKEELNYDMTGNNLFIDYVTILDQGDPENPEDDRKETRVMHLKKKEAEALAKKLYEETQNIYFMPSTTTAQGMPYLEPGDAITVFTKNAGYETIVFARDMKGIHTLKDTLDSK